jgi:hypothetical protein
MPEDHTRVKLDFSNAFNLLCPWDVLLAIQRQLPHIYSYCYSDLSHNQWPHVGGTTRCALVAWAFRGRPHSHIYAFLASAADKLPLQDIIQSSVELIFRFTFHVVELRLAESTFRSSSFWQSLFGTDQVLLLTKFWLNPNCQMNTIGFIFRGDSFSKRRSASSPATCCLYMDSV